MPWYEESHSLISLARGHRPLHLLSPECGGASLYVPACEYPELAHVGFCAGSSLVVEILWPLGEFCVLFEAWYLFVGLFLGAKSKTTHVHVLPFCLPAEGAVNTHVKQQGSLPSEHDTLGPDALNMERVESCHCFCRPRRILRSRGEEASKQHFAC